MILTQGQAEAVYRAMCELNNLGASMEARIPAPGKTRITVEVEGYTVTVMHWSGYAVRNIEDYPDQAAFASAYKLS